jgi:hypothetical protein
MSDIETKVTKFCGPIKPNPSLTCCAKHIGLSDHIAHYEQVEGSMPIRLSTEIYSDESINLMITSRKQQFMFVISECRSAKCNERKNTFVVSAVVYAAKSTILVNSCKSAFCRKQNLAYIYNPEDWTFIGNLVD